MDRTLQQTAESLLRQFKGETYAFGHNAMDKLASLLASLGRQVLIFAGKTARESGRIDAVAQSVHWSGGVTCAVLDAAGPNAPVDDVQRMAWELSERPSVDCIVTIGGGSAIDAAKAAGVLNTLGGDLEQYYGVGKVGQALVERQTKLVPQVAVMTAASSAAHLTKYSNITRTDVWQKKLIIDEAIVPPAAVFDYAITTRMDRAFTLDGAFDGLGHCLEVYLGATGKAEYDLVEQIALTGMELIIGQVNRAASHPDDLDARTSLGLGTDLGGYAIMVGGTTGAHLNSFSMVDILSHGRAVAILNPYYVTFFAPACERQLRQLAALYRRTGWIDRPTDALHGRDLGLAVADAMLSLAGHVGFPTRLADVPGFSDDHLRRCLTAAKNPQLRSKLENMPVRLTPEGVDEFMGSVLDAAVAGDPQRVRNMA